MISVIIPAKDAGLYLKEAVESIIKQNFKDLEIIVIDDSSTDNTSQIAQSLGCITKKVNYCHVDKTRNEGLKIAKGDFIMFLDADDVMTENSINTLYNELISDNSAEIVLGLSKDFIQEGTDITLESLPQAAFGRYAGCALIRKEVFNKTGLLDETSPSGVFLEFGLKLQQLKINIKKINTITVNRRIHNSNMSRKNKKQEFKDYIAVLRKQLANKKTK